MKNRHILIHQGSQVLCKIADLHVVSQGECSRVVCEFAHDTFDKGGFSFSVSSDECHFFPSFQGKMGIVEHFVAAVVFG